MNMEDTFRNNIRGARKVGLKNQYLISCGLPSLDAIFGGGLSLGSIVLIEEDEFGTFAKMVLKCFLSEGIVSDHSLYIASQEADAEYWSSHLPALLVENDAIDSKSGGILNVAWRYQDMPKCNSAPTNVNPLSNTYDVTRYIELNKVKNGNVRYYNSSEDDYCYLLKDIYNTISEEKIAKGNGFLMRIVLHGLGSVLWNGNLPLFLHQLRGILRNEFAACIISIPTNLIQREHIVKRCEHICDAVVKFESLTDKQNPAYSDYSGLIHLLKLPAVNKWTFYKPETANWGLQLKRKQLLIEKIHISPELGENVSREEEDVSNDYLPG